MIRRPRTPARATPTLTRRELLARLGGGALTAMGGCASSTRQTPWEDITPPEPDLIRRENDRPGTREWLLTRTGVAAETRYRCPRIEGYCSHTSARAGETITFHVSTDPPSRFFLDIYRLGFYDGLGGRLMRQIGPLDGRAQLDPFVGPRRLRDCAWPPSATLQIPHDWPSGVYVGKLTAERDDWQSYVIFLVRDQRQVDFIVQCSDTTWQAYNRWPDHYALYDDGVHEWYWGGDVAVSFNRPYAKYCQIVDAPLSIGSGEFFLWEFPVAFWLEMHGYDVSYVSALDTHFGTAGLQRASGFLSVGHDEYYTLDMFDRLLDAVADGLNIAFLSGNTCCGRIALGPDRRGALRTFERVDVYGPPDIDPIRGMQQLPHRSPDASALVGARSHSPWVGGADWICIAPDHWLYAGTGMKHGERIDGLIGWEWQGDPADIPGLEVVAAGPTQIDQGTRNGGIYTATIYPGPADNVVFNASTCWWGDGLSAPPGYLRPSIYTTPRGPDRRVQRITRNLLARMRGEPPR